MFSFILILVLFEFKCACDTLAGQHDANLPCVEKKRSTYFSPGSVSSSITSSHLKCRKLPSWPTHTAPRQPFSFFLLLSFIAALLVSLHLPLSIVKPTLSKDKLSRKQKLLFWCAAHTLLLLPSVKASSFFFFPPVDCVVYESLHTIRIQMKYKCVSSLTPSTCPTSFIFPAKHHG